KGEHEKDSEVKQYPDHSAYISQADPLRFWSFPDRKFLAGTKKPSRAFGPREGLASGKISRPTYGSLSTVMTTVESMCYSPSSRSSIALSNLRVKGASSRTVPRLHELAHGQLAKLQHNPGGRWLCRWTFLTRLHDPSTRGPSLSGTSGSISTAPGSSPSTTMMSAKARSGTRDPTRPLTARLLFPLPIKARLAASAARKCTKSSGTAAPLSFPRRAGRCGGYCILARSITLPRFGS